MAEENVNIDNLDEAASQYDFLRSGTPNIEVPDYNKSTFPEATDSYIKANYPATRSVDNPAYPMRDQVTGLNPYGLSALPKGNTKDMDFSSAVHANLRRSAFNREDKNVYAKTYSYDASPQGAHMARYKAYGQDTFDRIGFNPELNNEAIFNDQTTMTDDFVRMLTHSAWPMLKLGFMAPIKSYHQLFSGDDSNDTKEAEKYSELNAVGYSTKGGLGGFTNNVLLSAAYSAGIVGEAIGEGMLIGAIEGSLVGPEGTAAGGALGAGVGAVKGLLSLPKSLWQMGRYGSQMLTNLKNAEKYAVAKEMFTTASKTVGDFINPVTNSKDALANNVFSNSDNLSRMARAAKTFGGFYNDVKNINAALSEGSLEAGFVENDMYKDLYDKYYSQNGVAPTSDEQRQMRVQSKIASAHAKMWNTGLIFYTNKITLPAVFGTRVFKNATQTVARAGGWKAIFDPKSQVYEAVKVNSKNALKGLIRPSNYGKVSLAYFKTNIAEGIQENLQDVIADTSKKYYTDAFYDESKATFDYSMGALYGGLKNQWGSQGAETFLSGFAMGAILRPLNNVRHWMSIGYNKYYKHRDNWSSYQGEREGAIKELVNHLNNMHEAKNGPDFLNLRAWNMGAVGSIAKVLNDENLVKKEEIDAKHSLLTNSLISTLQNGYLDMFMENFKGYKQMTPKEIEDAMGLQEGEGSKALAKIDEIVQKSKTIKARHDYGMKLHAPDIKLSDYKKGTPEYKKAEIKLRAHQIGVRNLVFLQEAFDNNLERINKINNEFANLPGFGDTPSTYIQALLDPARLNTELEMLRTEVDAGGDNVEQKREILKSFEELQDAEKMYSIEFLSKLKDKFSKMDASIENEEILKELESFSEVFREAGINPEEDYKNAFGNVLRALSGNDNVTFHKFLSSPESDNSVDSLFESVLDAASLKAESRALVPYINTLLDPQGFAEHIDRNFQWMNDLYNNRKDYYKEIINKQIQNIEYNSLLADLADEGIYVDLDEFAEFVESGKLPTYFIDSVNDMIINEDSVLYDDYIDKFYMALENRNSNPAGEKSTLEEQLEERLKELNDQRAKELDDAKILYGKELQKETGKTEDELLKLMNTADDQDEEQKAALQTRLDQLKLAKENIAKGTVEEIAAIVTALVDQKIIPADNSVAAQEFIKSNSAAVQQAIIDVVQTQRANGLPDGTDASGAVVDEDVLQAGIQKALIPSLLDEASAKIEQQIKAIKPKNAKAIVIENTKAYIAYQKTVTEINDKYDKLIDEVKAEYAKKMTGNEKPKPTTDTPWEELPTSLKDKLTPVWDEFKTQNNITEEEEPQARQNWLKSQSLAIEEYNSQVAAGTLKVSIPKLKFLPNEFDVDGEMIGLEDLKMYQLRALRNTAQSYINTNKKPDPADEENTIPLTADERTQLLADVEALNEYINSVRTSFRADAAFEAKLELFKQRVLDRQSEIEEELDDNGNVVARYLDGKIAQRVTKHAEKIQSEMLNKEPFIFGSVKETTDADGNVKTPWTLSFFRSLLDNAAMSSEQKVAAFISEFRKKTTKGQFAEESKVKDLEKALKTDFSEDNLIRTINKLAYRESTIAGNTVDVLIRDFFTLDAETGFKKITKPANMTQEAFDALFGDRGIITEYRDGMIDGKFFLLSNNLNVFDSSLLETGLAGAMDIVAIDEDGNFFIVDIKTSTKENWDKFDEEYLYKVKAGETIEDIAKKYKTTVDKIRELNAEDQSFAPGNTIFVASDVYSKKLYYRLQQSMYRNLFYNMTGEMPSRIGLLPIEISYDLTGFIKSAKKASIIPEGESTVDLEYAPEVEEYGVTLIKPTFTETEVAKGEVIPVPTTEPSEVKYEQETPEDTSLGANLGKTVLYKGRVGKLVVSDDGTYGVEFPNNEIADLYAGQSISETGTTTLDLNAEMLPVKNKDVIASQVGIQFITEVVEPMVTQTVEEETFHTEILNKDGSRIRVNDIEYRVNKNKNGQVVSLTYNSNDNKIKAIDQETQQLTIELNSLMGLRDLSYEERQENQKKIAQLKSNIQSNNNRRDQLAKANQSRTIRGGNAQNIILALNSTPQTFSEGHTTKTAVDEVRDLKEVSRLANSEKVSQKIDEILSAEYPAALDKLFTQGISAITAADRSNIIKWAETTIEQLENYGYTLLAMDQITTDVENQIKAINQLLNDLKLIQLTKDGRISKKQPEARKVFQPEKVQTGPSVPAVPKPVRQREEGVPGEERGKTKPTRQKQSEVKSSIKSILSKQNDEEIASELLGTKQKTPVAKETNKFIRKLNSAKTKDDLLIIKADAHAQHAQDPTSIEIGKFDKAFIKKLATFNTDITTDSLKSGDYLVRKDDTAATTIYVFERLTLDGDAVLVELGSSEPINYSKLPTYNDEDLAQFRRIDMEDTTEVPEEVSEVNEETMEASTESAQNLEDLKKEPGAFDNVKDAATKADKKSRLKNLKDNSNKC